jgi:drug/metabolite transporter (DMT)-like permease
MRGRWPLSALFAVTVWGAAFVASKAALGTAEAPAFTPFGLAALRFGIGGGVLLATLAWRGGPVLPEPSDRPRVVLLGLILGTHITIQTWGLRYTLATHASWIVCFTSVVIALGAQFGLGQRLRAIGWLGVLVASAGILGITGNAPLELAPRAGLGDLMQFSVCFTWAAYTLLGARPVRSSGALRVTTWAALTAGALLTAISAVTGFGRTIEAGHVLALLYLGVVSSAAAFLAWYHAQARYGSQRTGAMLYVEPFVTVLVASGFGEPLRPATILAGTVVLIGVWLVQRGATAVSGS